MALPLVQFIQADQAGIKLEIVQGTTTWEAFPASRHQRKVRDLNRSIRPSPSIKNLCGCHYLDDVYIRFPDGSIKRPDISMFCDEPPISDEALDVVPGAVVEIISKGYEAKDTVIGPEFYLAQGVKDVIVIDPYQNRIHHFTSSGVTVLESPQTVRLSMGCELDA